MIFLKKKLIIRLTRDPPTASISDFNMKVEFI